MTDLTLERGLFLLVLPFLFLVIFLVHETGHYLLARFFGVRVKSFSVGAGPTIKSYSLGRDRTPLLIRLWPISGQVALNSDDLAALTPFKRLLIILAGPAANLLFPFFLYLPFLLLFGLPVQPPVVGGLMVGGPAEQAGLELGDRMVEINGEKVERFADLYPYSWDLPLEPFTLTVERDGKNHSLTLHAQERRYIDRRGIERTHGQIGVSSSHATYPIRDIRTIDGIDVHNDPARARELLTERGGQTIEIDLYMNDEAVHTYRVHVYPEANKKLNDPDDPERRVLYLSPHRYTYYLPLSFFQSIENSATLTGKKIKDIAGLPFQLFPIDKELLNYPAMLDNDITPVRNWLFRVLFKLALLSVAIGLINLLPLPRLDGSVVLYEGWEIITKKSPTNRQRAWLIMIGFLAFYLTAAIANFSNMPIYFEKKIQNTTEWFEDRRRDR